MAVSSTRRPPAQPFPPSKQPWQKSRRGRSRCAARQSMAEAPPSARYSRPRSSWWLREQGLEARAPSRSALVVIRPRDRNVTEDLFPSSDVWGAAPAKIGRVGRACALYYSFRKISVNRTHGLQTRSIPPQKRSPAYPLILRNTGTVWPSRLTIGRLQLLHWIIWVGAIP